LNRILDLGKWWRELTGLPLPLGANAIRKDLGAETIAIVCKALRDSIQHALDNREQALQYAMQFARDLDARDADKFVGMYVNERTLDYGDDGREAVAKLLNMGHDKGIIPPAIKLEWVGESASANKV
jgi:1,4-dihydroxy-6-naphthoate synthase